MKQLTITLTLPLLFALAAIGFTQTHQVKAAAETSIQISEFMPDPSQVSDTNGEWVELTNFGDEAISLQDWQLDGHTLPALTLQPNESFVFCRKSDPALNGGVICNETFTMSLTNSGKTLTLSNASGATIDEVAYSSDNISPGHSIQRTGSNLRPETTYQYGLGDFGEPANNEFGGIVVHAVTEKNHNKHPNLLGSEAIEAGWTIELRNADDSFRHSVETTGLNWPEAAGFATSPGIYKLCLLVNDETHFPTFAKKFTSYFTFADIEESKDATHICGQVEVAADDIQSYIFGARKKVAGPAQIRVHVIHDNNEDGIPQFGEEEHEIGWEVHLYDPTDWESAAEPAETVETTGLPYGEAARFELQDTSSPWIVCIDEPVGHTLTFARTIQSFTQYPEINNIPNTNNPDFESDTCVEVSSFDGEVTSLVFGVHQE